MAFPPEFQFANEDDFIQRFLTPLLQRLGFSLVVNYHGHAEFGKDLIFAEIDRFGHVRYHGLQAKYEPSISLNEVEGLVSDCKQAFSNPFTHPQTGTNEKISSFYAVNGGSLGTEATHHYFNSLLPLYGGNARLLQAKDLLTLDRWASFNQTANVTAVINGLLIELNFNQIYVLPQWVKPLQDCSEDKQGITWPISRFKGDAFSTYLRQPGLQNFLNIDHILQYWEIINVCNRMFDALSPGRLAFTNRCEFAQDGINQLAWLDKHTPMLRSALQGTLNTLGPLSQA